MSEYRKGDLYMRFNVEENARHFQCAGLVLGGSELNAETIVRLPARTRIIDIVIPIPKKRFITIARSIACG
jgi:hypothetical protein